VRSGETLSGIAAANGTTAGALATRNGLANPNLIVPGQQLSVR
jgi:LysM repeat protein